MTGSDFVLDAAIRADAMAYVQGLVDRDGGVVTRADLESFMFAGRRMPLLDQSRGIRNPVELPATLSILTTRRSPYDDTAGAEGLLRYSMRAGDPGGGDNRKLRRAFELGVPLIWFHQVAPGVFAPVMPVYLVGEESADRRFVVALGDDQRLERPGYCQAPQTRSAAATPNGRASADSISQRSGRG